MRANDMFQVSAPSELTALDELVECLEQFAETALLTAKVRHQLCLIVEELFVNFVKHADSAGGQFDVTIERDAGRWRVDITDNGPRFDPLKLETPDVDAPLEMREVGGLGIYLVRELGEDIAYRRADDRNHIELFLCEN